MHTLPVLHKFFRHAFPEIHATRLEALAVAVDAVCQGARVSITAMGRGLNSPARIKHRVKRMNRLVGNRLLTAERERFYRAMTWRLIASTPQPVILVDWSDFNADRAQQLLRASLPVGGRAITLYEELHPYEKLANRATQHQFLDRLKTMLPAGCAPVIVADAGFRTPFFRHVEQLGWHWLGRIRNRDFIRWQGAPYEWVGAKSLYALATTRVQELGEAEWVRRNPLAGRLVLIRSARRGRKDRTLNGAPRRSAHSRKQAKRNNEPWLLIASPSLQAYCARQIVRLYKTRMQCEENFRDTKSVAFGFGIARERYTSFLRATNLLLIAALAHFLLWLIGSLARARRWDQAVRVTSAASPNVYSTVFLARLVIQHLNHRLPRDCLNDADKLVPNYFQPVAAT
ncbi:MAG: IS4 family transposase [Bryobacteraceae bacterium]